ncbi:TrkA family potassium uptake protein [Asticcacaulis sp. AND118]|uniref:potassium channel family protein n=1 Tax=Asticcacaulis sp. AND118 TaxID=2840468 RepID=UPI001CFF87F5|nr:potassium channel family protein [Asticcacaulis sp. AND118]UDF04006.1 potassium channel family protein [Asticcacaulis sp. AND118]
MPGEVFPYITLNRKGRLSLSQSLAMRGALVLALILVALAGHWLDRGGLRDNTDGHVSTVDVLYFTAVTVSTVGYGDIVPVTDRARMFDTFVVTPIRLFIWVIFLGTAYSFVVKSTWERIRTHMIRKGLTQHIIVYGYGAGGEAAVNELLRQKVDPGRIVVVDKDADRITAAMERGVIVIECDATHNSTQAAAGIDAAHAVIVSMGRDDTTALVVLSARAMNPHVSISATVRAVENEDLIRQAGADHVINPVSFGGHLLARAAEGRHVVDYISDLASADGKVVMRQREVTADEIGQPLDAIRTGMGVRICRDNHVIGYWEDGARSLRKGDILIEIIRTDTLTSFV